MKDLYTIVVSVAVLASVILSSNAAIAQSCGVATPIDKVCCCVRTKDGSSCSIQAPDAKGRCSGEQRAANIKDNEVCPCIGAAGRARR